MEMKKRIILELRNRAPEKVRGGGAAGSAPAPHGRGSAASGQAGPAAPPNLGQAWRRSPAGRGRKRRPRRGGTRAPPPLPANFPPRGRPWAPPEVGPGGAGGSPTRTRR